jgi:hypothetical protein
MGFLYKALSRALDYLWFWSILYFIIDIFDLDIVYFLIATLFITLLFIPVEAVLLKYFRTTLGKFIFGIRYNQPFTWKSAFRFSSRRAVFLKMPAESIYQKPKRSSHILAISVALLLSMLSIFPDATLNQASKVLPFDFIQELKVKRNGGGNCPDGWTKLTDTIELPFLAFFPESPKKSKEIRKELPHSTHVLVYKEYTQDAYSLGFVDLPKSWVSWGSNLVFKGTLQQILSREKGKLLDKKKTFHEQFPAMDYKIEKASGTSFGRLILVDTTVYRLEATTTDETQKESADLFINAFHLI